MLCQLVGKWKNKCRR